MFAEVSISSFIYHPAVLLTLKVSVIALLLQLLTGVPLGIYLAQSKSKTKYLVDLLVTLPMIFPPIALGFGLLLILGRESYLGIILIRFFDYKVIFSESALVIAAYIVGMPFMAKTVQTSYAQIPSTLLEASKTMGKSLSSIMFQIILPLVKGGIINGLILAFGRALGEVGISLMIGGNIIGRTETLSLAIYNAVYDGDLQKATIYSILLSVVALIVFVLTHIIHRTQIKY